MNQWQGHSPAPKDGFPYLTDTLVKHANNPPLHVPLVSQVPKVLDSQEDRANKKVEGIDYVNFDSIFSFIWGSEFTSGTTGTTCTTISTAVSLLLLKSTCIERDAHNPVLRSSNAETVIKKNQNKKNRTEDQS